MELRRIVLSLTDKRRVIIYPEGGLEVEMFVEGGIGWVIDTQERTSDHYDELGLLVRKASQTMRDVAKSFPEIEPCGHCQDRPGLNGLGKTCRYCKGTGHKPYGKAASKR